MAGAVDAVGDAVTAMRAGYVSLSVAARRLGVSVSMVHYACAAAGVPRNPYRGVAWLAVRDAVVAYLATETLKGAARARDLPVTTLTRWCRGAGVLPPPRPHAGPRGPVVRLSTEVIDRVVWWRRNAEGVLEEMAGGEPGKRRWVDVG